MLNTTFKSSIPFFLQRLSAISFFLIGLFWLAVHFTSSADAQNPFYAYLNQGAVFYLIAGAALLFGRVPGIILNFLITLGILNYGYLFLETYMHIKNGFDRDQRSITLFDQPCAQLDGIRGYRWTGTSCRTARVERGILIYDQIFPINNQGYVSDRPYFFRKTREGYRFLVFGDSFTVGEFLEKNWVDRLQQMMDDDRQKYEFYSFALDGAGLGNWYSIFFKEIIPQYEFDGLIFAVYNDDLYREPGAFHLTARDAYFGRFAPSGREDFLKNFSKMQKVGFVRKDSQYRKTLQRYASRFMPLPMNTGALNSLAHMTGKYQQIIKESREPQNPVLQAGRSAFDGAKKLERFEKLARMIRWCRENNKDAFIVYIPSSGDLTDAGRGRSARASELKEFSAHFDLPFYDGRLAFLRADPRQAVFEYWFKYDGHWNQKGSDLFAMGFRDALLQNSSSRK